VECLVKSKWEVIFNNYKGCFMKRTKYFSDLPRKEQEAYWERKEKERAEEKERCDNTTFEGIGVRHEEF